MIASVINLTSNYVCLCILASKRKQSRLGPEQSTLPLLLFGQRTHCGVKKTTLRIAGDSPVVGFLAPRYKKPMIAFPWEQNEYSKGTRRPLARHHHSTVIQKSCAYIGAEKSEDSMQKSQGGLPLCGSTWTLAMLGLFGGGSPIGCDYTLKWHLRAAEAEKTEAQADDVYTRALQMVHEKPNSKPYPDANRIVWSSSISIIQPKFTIYNGEHGMLDFLGWRPVSSLRVACQHSQC